MMAIGEWLAAVSVACAVFSLFQAVRVWKMSRDIEKGWPK